MEPERVGHLPKVTELELELIFEPKSVFFSAE